MRASTRAFWSRFAAAHWERKPLAVRRFNSPITQIDESEVFALLVKYADVCRKRKDADGFKFFVNGERAHEDDVLQILPFKKDRNLQGYHRRMAKLFDDYCLVCDELLRVNHEKQALLAEFTHDLYRHVGFPNRFAEMGLYLGNYRKTPFGVHVDGCGVFSFPVVGTKKFRLWTPEYARANPELDRAFDYDEHKKASQVLTGVPGGMTYWPSSSWHIAESDGSFSATWSLGVWVDVPFSAIIADATAQLFTEAFGADGTLAMTEFKVLHAADGEVSKLPPLHERAVKAFGKISEARLRERLLETWMLHVSKRGFKNGPVSALKLGATIALSEKNAPILWRQTSTNLSCGFSGSLTTTEKSTQLVRLLQALNAGGTCRVSDFIKGPSRTRDLKVLQALAKVGAFRTPAK